MSSILTITLFLQRNLPQQQNRSLDFEAALSNQDFNFSNLCYFLKLFMVGNILVSFITENIEKLYHLWYNSINKLEFDVESNDYYA